MPSFFDLYAEGKVAGDDIDDYVSAWHRGDAGEKIDLHEYLGMTWDEYAEWVKDDRALQRILAARREGRPVENVPALRSLRS